MEEKYLLIRLRNFEKDITWKANEILINIWLKVLIAFIIHDLFLFLALIYI